jgi:transcriptional regulator with XRE-family HTH domain
VSESFGDRVRRLRKEKHWSQEKLVEMSDVSIRHLREIERSIIPVQSLSIGIVEKLAQALSVHPAKLLYPDYLPN